MPRTKKHRGDQVRIVGIDLLKDENEERCHTDDYECKRYLVLRRGTDVQFELELSRPVSNDKLELTLHRGYRTSYRRGTRFTAELGVSPESENNNYLLAIKQVKSEGAKAVFALTIPPDFPVGSYRVEMEVTPEDSWNTTEFDVPKEFVVLFNPWCKDDGVYMSEEKLRDEYVMNESGLIYAGTYDDIFTWPWNFAQFDRETLDAVLYLLDMSITLDSDGRRNPMTVARVMTEMVNQEDDDGGILYGLWSSNDEDYEDGTHPTAWSGSAAILKEYLESKNPVRYAQCWVFGGTLTTILRCIGIPARPVTNFESAHDTNLNRAIDFYYDVNDEVVEEKSGDSIWNYHVWVESWMSRPDLGPTYGGWQAVDATPQEISHHSRSCVVGPASLVAIKDGQDLKYDNEFVIAEVNADIKYYYETEKGKFELSESNISKVGKNISTKSCGSEEREDLTDKYKYPEGSVQERAALGAEGDLAKASDVSFAMEFAKKAAIGDDVNIIVKAKTSGSDTRKVRLSVNVRAVNYIGVSKSSVKKFSETVEIKPDSESSSSFALPSSDYFAHLTDQALLSVTVLALVEGTNQSWVGKKTLPLRKPTITITVTQGKTKKAVDSQLKAGETYDVSTSFTNPLKKPLTNVVYFVEGAKLTTPLKEDGESIPAGENGEVVFQITPQKSRSKRPQQPTIIVTCQSKELKGIMGTATFTIV